MTPTEQRAWDERNHALKQIGVPMPDRVELARPESKACNEQPNGLGANTGKLKT